MSFGPGLTQSGGGYGPGLTALTPIGDVDIAEPATVSRLDPLTLVPSRVYDLAWTVSNPTLAAAVLPLAGDSTITGAGGLYWLGCDQQSPVGAYLAAKFTPAPGMTAVALEVDEVQRHPTVGATGALLVELWTVGDGSTVAAQSASYAVGASAANVTATVSVVPGTEYEIRLYANKSGTPCSCLIGRVRVRPVTYTDRRWGSVALLSVAGLLHGSRARPGYDLTQPRYTRRAAYAEVRIRTNAAWIIAATWSNAEAGLGQPRADIAVRVEGLTPAGAPGGASTTLLDPAQEQIGYTAITLPGTMVRAIVRDGEQFFAAYALSPQPRGSFLAALFVPLGAYVEAKEPRRLRIGLGPVDSKLAGTGATDPSKLAFAPMLRLRGYEVEQVGYGGSYLVSFSGTNALQELTAWQLSRCDWIVIQAGRNDVNSGGFAQSTVVTQQGQQADVAHALCSARVLFWGVSHESAASEAAGPWDTSTGTADTMRVAIAALATATGGDGKSRAGWSWNVDSSCVSTIADMAVGVLSPDGVHPGTEVQRRLVTLAEGTVTGCSWGAFPIRSLSPVLWCPADGIAGGSAMGTVTSTGTSPPTIALSGTPSTALYLMIRCSTGGPRGTATLQYSTDGGTKWSAAILTAATVGLGATGIAATCASGTYSNDDLWVAASDTNQVNDIGGNGNHITRQGVAANCSYQLQQIGGRPAWVIGNGTGGLHAAVSVAAPYAVGVVVQSTDSSTARSVFGPPSGKAAPLLYYDATHFYGYTATTPKQINAAAIPANPNSVVLVVNGASSQIWVNGVLATTGALDNVAINDIVFGYDSIENFAHQGPISEAIVWPNPTADQIVCWAGEMRLKYAGAGL